MPDTANKTLAIARLLLFLALVIGALVGVAIFGTDGIRDALEQASDSRWGVIGFIVLYALLVIAFAPGTVATITAAAIFGFTTGLVVSMTGASLGATGAFMISRALGRDGVVALLGDRLSRIDDFLGEREFVSILVLRLLPIVPFNGLNYAAGLSSVRLRNYVAATVLGILPGTTLTTFTVSRSGSPGSSGFLVGIGLTVAAFVVSSFFARRALARRKSNQDD